MLRLRLFTVCTWPHYGTWLWPWQHSPTPFLLSIISNLLVQVIRFANHLTGMLVMQISDNIFGEHICLVVLSSNKYNLDETIIDELFNEMVMNINMLGSWACANMLCHENGTNIIDNSTSLIPIKSKTWTMNLISFAASDKATNSALLEDRVMLLWALHFQLMGTPIKKTQDLFMLILVSASLV